MKNEELLSRIAQLLADGGETRSATQTPVLVTTAHRGVFFGYLRSAPGASLTLARARNCTYWSKPMRGFLGLASAGPDADCKIGPAAPSLYLMGVTSVSVCTPAAAERWEAAPWA